MGESFGGSVDMTSEKEKAVSTQDQLRIWDALLEVRIRMQKILLEVNKLPQTETFKRVVESPLSKDVKLPTSSNKALSNVQEFVENLLNLQEVMTLNNPETNGAINKKRKAKSSNGNDDDDDEDEGIDDDEEITSEEDEGKEDDHKEEEMELNSEDDKSENDEEEVPEKKKSTPVATKASTTTPPKKKKRRLTEYDKQIDTEFKKFASYRNDTIQKWNDKTQMAFGKFRSKGAGPQIPTLKQISHILSDKERLIKRTQVKRTAYTTIGKPDSNLQLSESAQDEEIFDDDDFYHQLLRELIDRKTTNVQDPVQLSRQWLELQKLRTKLKRVVDTDASKGRKIRYDVHPKLVNFMAPQDNCVMSESAVKELMSSLFGKLSN